jgi:hypothetical protein
MFNSYCTGMSWQCASAALEAVVVAARQCEMPAAKVGGGEITTDSGVGGGEISGGQGRHGFACRFSL